MVCESHSVVSNSLQPHGLYISLEFSRPEYWSGYFLSPGELPNPGIEPRSPTLQILYQLSYKGSPIYGMVGAQQIQDGQWMQTFPSSLGLFYPSLLRPGQYFIDRWGERECSAEKWTIAMNNQHRTFVKTKALFQSGVIYFQKLFLWVLCEADSLIDARSDVIYVVGIDTGEVDPTVLGDIDMLFTDQVFHLLGWWRP